MPEESMTRTHTTYLEHSGFRFALLRLDNGTSRPITLGPDSLEDLSAAIRSLDITSVDAVAVTGTREVFCAGADLGNMTEARTLDEAQEVARQGLRCFAGLATLPVPTFAFLNGLALGGGLELALHTDYRTVSATAKGLGFPEVRLGLIPGWGGLDRVLELLGPDTAARLAVLDPLVGKNLTPAAAHDLGLVDAVLPAVDFLTASLEFAAGVLAGTTAPWRRQPTENGPGSLDRLRDKLDAMLHGAAPAPYRALDLLMERLPDRNPPAFAEHTDPDNTTARAFGELLLSDQARAGIYALRLTRSLARTPAGRPDAPARPLRSIGVVGAGLMASQLALLFARQLRVPVLITDLSRDRVDKALEWIRAQLDRQVERGQLTADAALNISGLVQGTTDKTDFAQCDAVIEAVFEELEVKRAVFAELESILRPDALLLTNTSALSVEDICAQLAHPERLVGLHFFNPVSVLPLVEVIPTTRTAETSLATAFEMAKGLGKTAVLVKDSPGFVVNRILTRLMCEVLSLIDGGLEPESVDHALDPVGLPMTPLALLQFIGPAVQLHICERMRQAYPDRFAATPGLTAIVNAGLPGFLDANGGISSEAAVHLPPPAPADQSAIRSRLLSTLADEVGHILREGVVAGPEQVDLCMILGANYPFHTGGLTPLLDRITGTNYHPGLRIPLSVRQPSPASRF
ncbi:3-hydroxyacyl-CoA dehydrogenase NAD-binding domain-containing protein [Arthrobacter sp. OAP107]|uniref:3-hydroxyacyl-CoA dehydrogenase NAD-binding domain-containing protein n=1 Tax=Arthrobacter sp. OAP107 TaxID=3156445 RepID=UPI0033988ADE